MDYHNINFVALTEYLWSNEDTNTVHFWVEAAVERYFELYHPGEDPPVNVIDILECLSVVKRHHNPFGPDYLGLEPPDASHQDAYAD